MKKSLICALAVLALIFGACTMAGAAERQGRFDAGMGLGFNVGQGGNASFAWQFGGDYYFNNMIAVNPNFYLFVDGGTNFAIVPRVKFTFDLPWENFEAFAAGGGGVIVGDVKTTWAIVFGGGAYYWLLDGHLGLGTDMDFAINGTSHAHFRFVWAVASAMYRF